MYNPLFLDSKVKNHKICNKLNKKEKRPIEGFHFQLHSRLPQYESKGNFEASMQLTQQGQSLQRTASNPCLRRRNEKRDYIKEIYH